MRKTPRSPELAKR
jgi:putative transposase